MLTNPLNENAEPIFQMTLLGGLGASWKPLGGSWGRLGSLLGGLGAVFGASWEVLETSWEPLGELFRVSWAPLERS